VDTVPAEVKFVDQARAEKVSLAQCENLPNSHARVAKTREVGALRGFQAFVVLIRVVAVNAV